MWCHIAEDWHLHLMLLLKPETLKFCFLKTAVDWKVSSQYTAQIRYQNLPYFELRVILQIHHLSLWNFLLFQYTHRMYVDWKCLEQYCLWLSKSEPAQICLNTYKTRYSWSLKHVPILYICSDTNMYLTSPGQECESWNNESCIQRWHMLTKCCNILKLCILPTECYVFCMNLWITAVISLNSIKQVAFVMEAQCVFCDIGTESLSIVCMNFVLERVKCLGLFSLS
jgi:hypothetical protein